MECVYTYTYFHEFFLCRCFTRLLILFLTQPDNFSILFFSFAKKKKKKTTRTPSESRARAGVLNYSLERYTIVDDLRPRLLATSLSVFSAVLPPPFSLSFSLPLSSIVIVFSPTVSRNPAASILVITGKLFEITNSFYRFFLSREIYTPSAKGTHTFLSFPRSSSSFIYYNLMISGARNCTLLQYFTSWTILLS